MGSKSELLESFLNNYGKILFQIAHCLVYVNSCLNPIIYNLMSGKYNTLIETLSKTIVLNLFFVVCF